MDSGSTVPTLNPGFNETAAVKLFTIATGRSDDRRPCEMSFMTAPLAAGATGAILLFSARFFAADNAGNNSAARTEMMTMTTINSMSVKPRRGIFTMTSRVRAFEDALVHDNFVS